MDDLNLCFYFSISNARNCLNNPRSVMEISPCKEDLIDPIYLVQLHVIKITSKYNTMTWNNLETCYKYTLGSDLHLSNPSESKKLSILAYQSLGACLRQHRDLFNLHTSEGS